MKRAIYVSNFLIELAIMEILKKKSLRVSFLRAITSRARCITGPQNDRILIFIQDFLLHFICTTYQNIGDIYCHVHTNLGYVICDTYVLDVLWPCLSRLIQPMYYSGNHELSYEYLSFIFCSAIIFCT